MMAMWRIGAIAGIVWVLMFVMRYVADKTLTQVSFKQWFGSSAVLFLLCVVIPQVQAAIPDRHTLNELRQWLHQPAACAPNCITLSGLRLLSDSRAGQEYLILEAQVDAFANTAFAIPHSEHWALTQITYDGRPYNWLAHHQGQDWLYVEHGRHRIRLVGLVSGATSFRLSFPERPFNVQNLTDIWDIEGLHNGSVLTDELIFTKQAQAIALASDEKLSGLKSQAQQVLAIEPMVKVIRHLWLDNEWRMRTQVIRIAPQRGDLHVAIPQLSFERIMTTGITPEQGMIKVHLAAGVSETSWLSTLERQASLELVAPDDNVSIEEWRFHIAHQWRAEFSGVPQVWPEPFMQDAPWSFRYLPWSGEQLKVSLMTPEAIKGYSQSFDQVVLRVSPGEQQRLVSLETHYRSSRGGQGQINVGDGYHLNAMVDEKNTHLQLQNGLINYTIAPGEHRLNLNWKQSHAMHFRTELPKVNLEAPLSNVSIEWQIPQNRWVLWTSGPVIGPAIIYWGELLVFLVLAVVIWRSRWLPIKPLHWLLLGLGLSTQNWWLLVVMTLWFVALSAHSKYASKLSDNLFNLLQIVLMSFSALVLLALLATIPMSLMGHPDMGIVGNQSTGQWLKWYSDAATDITPEVVVYSLPLWVYKLAMLTWALWLAFSLVSWARWGWSQLSSNGVWRTSKKVIAPSALSSSTKQPPSSES
jgi:hypothetical protein